MVKTGRPCKEINEEQFESLCAFQCTEREICDWFNVEGDTLNGRCKRTHKNEHGKDMT